MSNLFEISELTHFFRTFATGVTTTTTASSIPTSQVSSMTNHPENVRLAKKKHFSSSSIREFLSNRDSTFIIAFEEQIREKHWRKHESRGRDEQR